jgi:hypothetical protein
MREPISNVRAASSAQLRKQHLGTASSDEGRQIERSDAHSWNDDLPKFASSESDSKAKYESGWQRQKQKSETVLIDAGTQMR